jgi:hypothetical protein
MTTTQCTAVIPVKGQWIINYNKELLEEVAEVILVHENPEHVRSVFDRIMEFIGLTQFNKALELLHSFGNKVLLCLRNGVSLTYCASKEIWVVC